MHDDDINQIRVGSGSSCIEGLRECSNILVDILVDASNMVVQKEVFYSAIEKQNCLRFSFLFFLFFTFFSGDENKMRMKGFVFLLVI